MQTIQLALHDPKYSEALRTSLASERIFQDWAVEQVPVPEPGKAGVWVIDTEALAQMAVPLPHPEKIVLITRNEPDLLTRAWQAGIVSVVFEHDPLSTATLAVLAARYRPCKFVP